MTTTPLPLRTLLGFNAPAFSLAALGLPLAVILPPMYAELGISLTVVGTVFMAARFFDVGTDPLFGVLGDRVRTRWGRRKPAIVVGVPILLFGAYRVFIPSQPVTPTDLLVSMLIMYVGWTLLTLAHTAWASELSTDYDQRSRIMGIMQFCGLAGAVTVISIPALVDYLVPDATMALRSSAMGWLIFTSLPVFFLLALFSAREPAIKPTPELEWREGIRSIFRNRALARLLAADLLMGIQGGINGSVHFFFVGIVLNMPQSASLYLVVIFLTGFLCVPLFIKISERFGKHRTLCFGALQSSVATAAFFVVPAESFWWVFVIFVGVGVNFGAKDFMMRAIMADVIDQDRVNTGAERSALYYSMLTLTNKVGIALAVGFIYPMLDLVGFDPTGVNSPETLDGVRMVVAATPTLVTLSVAALMWRFPLGKTEQQALRKAIDGAS